MWTEVRASHILVETEKEANELLKRIEAGESFEELAKKYSKCPSGRNGGDLGYFTRGMMVPEFEEAAFELPKGKVSKPVQTDFGYHLIKVYDKR
jgi:parvulin-like peptidyl-prolyl isomerase